MKDLKTSLQGKIRNLPDFKSEALLPLFEAVVNAIQAIEEKGNIANGEITVQVLRSPQMQLQKSDLPTVIGFSVTDNGVGFTDENFESFQTSDSVHKLAKGGKGVGRFLWLKAFDRVEVESVFEIGSTRKLRSFQFSVAKGIGEGTPVDTRCERKTIVKLVGFKKEYQDLPSAFKTTKKIAQRILEHCLSYFVAEGAPRIVVRDDDEPFFLNDIFEAEFKENIVQQPLVLKGEKFQLTHIKLYATHDRMHNIVLCADRRDVKSISLARALGTSSQFDDADQKFTYALYVTSPYLDGHCNHYRLDFDLPTEGSLLHGDEAVTESEIIRAVTDAAKDQLKEHLVRTRQRKEEKIASHIDNENPALRAVPVTVQKSSTRLIRTAPPRALRRCCTSTKVELSSPSVRRARNCFARKSKVYLRPRSLGPT